MKINRIFNSSSKLTLESIIKPMVNNKVETLVNDYIKNLHNEATSSEEKEIA